MSNKFEQRSDFEERLLAAISRAGEAVGAKLRARIEDKISEPVERDFTGQSVTRAEQGFGPGDPPRLDTGTLHANIEANTERRGDEVATTVSASNPENPEVPAILEFEMSIPFMGVSLLEYADSGELERDFAAALKQELSHVQWNISALEEGRD